MNRKLKKNIQGFTQIVPMILVIVIVFALLFIGVFVNGEINQSLQDTFPSDRKGTEGSMMNKSVSRLANISVNQDSTIDIVQVVIIITVLASAIAAIFLFTRFGT